MTILCGTDFSDEGMSALRVAIKLAHRLGSPLHVAHALAFARNDRINEQIRVDLAEDYRKRLEEQVEKLSLPGSKATVHIGEGPADEVMLTIANQLSASLIVVGALGDRQPSKWQLGSHADRLAQRSHVPVLVVRRGSNLEAWAEGKRALRVVLGADVTEGTRAAMAWVSELSRAGRCEVVAAHVYWPPQQFERLGLSGVRSYVDPSPVVTETLEREIKAVLGQAPAAALERLRVEPSLGRIGERLAHIADEERADLVVVGSRARGWTARWEGSVSRTALRVSTCSVACVPAPAEAAVPEVAGIRSVLVATDFSSTGNAAIALACAVAAPGANVHLAHVVPGAAGAPTTARDILAADQASRPEHAELREQLGKLVPPSTREREQSVELHVLESHEPAAAIAQAAERLGAELICIGTHGRTGLSKVLLGSVAQDVLARTRRPVLLARAPTL